MPFTLAHPAAVVPLRLISRRYLSFSALVVGSLSPDFEYLFRLNAVSRFSHTFTGLLYFCVPVGLIGFWLFHKLVKQPVILLQPSFMRQRLAPSSSNCPFSDLGHLAAVLISLALGAFTHIAWDSLTHEHGWVVERGPALRASVYSIAGHELRLYKLLQHGSTISGLLLLTYWLWRWLSTEPLTMPSVESLPEGVRRRILVALTAATCVIGLSIGLWSAAQSAGLQALQVFVVQSAVGGMAAFAACVLLFSLLYKLVAPRRTLMRPPLVKKQTIPLGRVLSTFACWRRWRPRS